MNLSELHRQLNELYPNFNEQEKLYNENYFRAIMNEGFNQKMAETIAYKAWQDGHSAGYTEVVNVTWDLIEFARDIIKANSH